MNDDELHALLKATFAEEANSVLADLDVELRQLDDVPAGPRWADIRRHAHTIKGAARAVGFDDLQQQGAALEQHFKAFENGEREPDSEAIDQAWEMLARLRASVIRDTQNVSEEERSAPVPVAVPAGSPKLLVVDDSVTIRHAHIASLPAAGFEVILAEDGAKAWDLLQQHEVAAVVSDVEMPNLDGLGLARKVRSDARFEDLPFVLVTTLDGDADRRRGLNAGANVYLPKSAVGSPELVDVLKKLIGEA